MTSQTPNLATAPGYRLRILGFSLLFTFAFSLDLPRTMAQDYIDPGLTGPAAASFGDRGGLGAEQGGTSGIAVSGKSESEKDSVRQEARESILSELQIAKTTLESIFVAGSQDVNGDGRTTQKDRNMLSGYADVIASVRENLKHLEALVKQGPEISGALTVEEDRLWLNDLESLKELAGQKEASVEEVLRKVRIFLAHEDLTGEISDRTVRMKKEINKIEDELAYAPENLEAVFEKTRAAAETGREELGNLSGRLRQRIPQGRVSESTRLRLSAVSGDIDAFIETDGLLDRQLKAYEEERKERLKINAEFHEARLESLAAYEKSIARIEEKTAVLESYEDLRAARAEIPPYPVVQAAPAEGEKAGETNPLEGIERLRLKALQAITYAEQESALEGLRHDILKDIEMRKTGSRETIAQLEAMLERKNLQAEETVEAMREKVNDSVSVLENTGHELAALAAKPGITERTLAEMKAFLAETQHFLAERKGEGAEDTLLSGVTAFEQEWREHVERFKSGVQKKKLRLMTYNRELDAHRKRVEEAESENELYQYLDVPLKPDLSDLTAEDRIEVPFSVSPHVAVEEKTETGRSYKTRADFEIARADVERDLAVLSEIESLLEKARLYDTLIDEISELQSEVGSLGAVLGEGVTSGKRPKLKMTESVRVLVTRYRNATARYEKAAEKHDTSGLRELKGYLRGENPAQRNFVEELRSYSVSLAPEKTEALLQEKTRLEARKAGLEDRITEVRKKIETVRQQTEDLRSLVKEQLSRSERNIKSASSAWKRYADNYAGLLGPGGTLQGEGLLELPLPEDLRVQLDVIASTYDSLTAELKSARIPGEAKDLLTELKTLQDVHKHMTAIRADTGILLEDIYDFSRRADQAGQNARHAVYPDVKQPFYDEVLAFENEIYSLRLEAQDPYDDLKFSLQKGPEAMQLDAATGWLTWTPERGSSGVYPLHIQVSDGLYTIDIEFVIYVEKK